IPLRSQQTEARHHFDFNHPSGSGSYSPSPQPYTFTNSSEPPDLYSSLGKTPIPPPDYEFLAQDPNLKPCKQAVRFEGDLYTPQWVRGIGHKREGWCGLCAPGRWLVLKNSAYWYDKSFTHGVCAATGKAFDRPDQTRRTADADFWEGLCGSCGEWIALVSSKKKGTAWFRHAHKVSAIAQFPSNDWTSIIVLKRLIRYTASMLTRFTY
ncbi:hypothetical protein LTR16_006120, partial [Cryomyces antarcticus]